MIYYFAETGQITRRADVPFDEASLCALDGEQWIQSDDAVSDATYFIFNGAITPFPAQPSPAHVWDWGLYDWVPSPAALAELKFARSEAVNALRDQKRAAPISYMGILFDADSASVANMQGLATRIERGDGLTLGWIGWRTWDNTMVWASEGASEVLAHLHALARALEDRQQSLLLAAWRHKAALLQCEGGADVLAYDITVGWPP